MCLEDSRFGLLCGDGMYTHIPCDWSWLDLHSEGGWLSHEDEYGSSGSFWSLKNLLCPVRSSVAGLS